MKQAVGLKRIIVLSIILSFVVILLGAYTRLKGAGLGCPDWPGCYGQLSAPLTTEEVQLAQQSYPGLTVEYFKAKIEMVHRYFAGSLGLFIALIAFMAFRARKKIALPLTLPLILVILVICQALLGMFTVTMRLNPPIVLLHLIGGFSTLSLLWICWLYLQKNAAALLQTNTRLITLSIAALIVVITQIALGGWVSTNYSALICTDFPMCQGQWLPSSDVLSAFPFWDLTRLPDQLSASVRINIQLTHRIGALITTIIISFLAFSLWRSRNNTIDPKAKTWLSRSVFLLLGLLVTQICLGITNVLALLPTAIAVLHNGIAVLLLLTLININFKLIRAGK
tara:strand:+ start:20596 stop:21612 length:1017 start_codon:yes stop_codon:yes gene_type:complete